MNRRIKIPATAALRQVLRPLSTRAAVLQDSFSCHLAAARTFDEFIQRALDALRGWGVSEFGHIYLRYPADACDMVGACPPALRERYTHEGFHRDDLFLQHFLMGGPAIFRSQIDEYIAAAPFKSKSVGDHRLCCNWLQGQAIHETYGYPIPDATPAALFFCSTIGMAASDFQETIHEHRHSIQRLARAFDAVGRQKFKQKFHGLNNPNLLVARRPLELLQIMSEKDFTLREAANFMGIQLSTANIHIAAAKKALGASTLHGLMDAARREGLLRG